MDKYKRFYRKAWFYVYSSGWLYQNKFIYMGWKNVRTKFEEHHRRRLDTYAVVQVVYVFTTFKTICRFDCLRKINDRKMKQIV